MTVRLAVTGGWHKVISRLLLLYRLQKTQYCYKV